MAIEAAIDLAAAAGAGFAGGRGGIGVEYISQDPSSRGVLLSGAAFAAAAVVAGKAGATSEPGRSAVTGGPTDYRERLKHSAIPAREPPQR
jgi:hypothetical protein